MKYNFDQVIERRDTDSFKWQFYKDDVLPLWAADMDFVSPEPVIRVLSDRVQHGIFGYGEAPQALLDTICKRMYRLQSWEVIPEQIVFLPGLVPGLNVVCQASGQPGNSVLIQTPIFSPFLSAPKNQGLEITSTELSLMLNGKTLQYEIDFEAFEAAITPQTRLFILCNPHNPIGRGFRLTELTKMAEICIRHDLIICSDEIHSDLLLDGNKHYSIAALSPEIAERTVTLLAPSKTFNIAGLGCSMAIIQNPELRDRFNKAAAGIVPGVNLMGFAAALAAYSEGDEWLTQVLAYLKTNRDVVINYVDKCLPGISSTAPEATYLTWLDCRQANIKGNPHEFFLEKAKVALNDGATFGAGGEGFVRLNFACPQTTLRQALEQMRSALVTSKL